MKKMLLSATIFIFLIQAVQAETTSRRATVTGDVGNGRCAIAVDVDGAAEIEVFSDVGNLRTLSGQPAHWGSFQCNVPLPHMPHDFRLGRITGRGTVQLVHDPRGNRGMAVIHIRDPKAGRDRYIVELVWRSPRSGWPPTLFPGPGVDPARSIQACQDSVRSRLNRDGYSFVRFARAVPDNNLDMIRGTATARRRHDAARFAFFCSVDSVSARVRSLDIQRRRSR